jgi:hybrid cluster-associated redox disulfide protein
LQKVLRLNPKTLKVFMAAGMHCIGCGAATGESVAQAAMVHGIDADKLLAELNKV